MGFSRLKSHGRPKKKGYSVITEILKQKEVYQKRHMYVINQDGDGMPIQLVRVWYLMELGVIFFKGQRIKIVYKEFGTFSQICIINMKIS
jgi:hypothetical protein